MLKQLSNLTVGARIAFITGSLCLLALALAIGGMMGMADSAARLKTVYEENLLPMNSLTEITAGTEDNKLLIMQANVKMVAGEAVNAHEVKNRFEITRSLVDKHWQKYISTPMSDEEKGVAGQLAKDLEAYRTAVAPALKALESFTVSEFIIAFERADKLFPAVRDGISQLIAQQMERSKASYEAAQANYEMARNVMIAALAVGLILGILFSLLMARSITGPVAAMQQALTEAARAHDLTQRVPVSGQNEIGRMALAFNTLMQALQDTLKKVVDGAQEVSSAAAEMAAASGQITETSGVQAEAAAATAAAVEQVTVSINQVAESTRETKAVSDQASALSANGETTARNTAAQMARTADSVAQSMQMIESLSQRSNEISGIVKVIRDIAEQTNLLALNAAIEAARAGEQGRGFAVVADEVRKLAERTSSSTSEISGMIEAIQSEVQQAVGNLKSNNEQVAEGRKLAEAVAETLASIHQGSRTTTQRIHDISSAATEQGNASNDIARNVEKIAQMSEETNAAVSQAAEAAGKLETLAGTLHAEVSRFRT